MILEGIRMSYYMPSDIRGCFLVITDACNLRCKYCFVKQKPNYMNLKIAKDSMDFINDVKFPDKPFHVQFFGGEPTLMWDSIIVPVVEYVKQKKYNIEFDITSNGILLDENKIKYMKENNIGLLFSMDGDKNVQDLNRPCRDSRLSSFNILEPKLNLISGSFPGVVFRSTFTPETTNYIFDSIMFASKHGFKYTFTCPNDFENDKYTEKNYKEIEDSICKYMVYYVDNYRRKYLPEDFIELNNFREAIEDSFKIDERSSDPEKYKPIGDNNMCGLGLFGFGINFEGKLFGCHELCSQMYENNKHYIGDIYLGYDEEKIKELRDLYVGKELYCEDPEFCETCNRYTVCGKGICHANSYQRFGVGNIKAKIRCVYDQLLTKYAFMAREILKNDVNSYFYKRYYEGNNVR